MTFPGGGDTERAPAVAFDAALHGLRGLAIAIVLISHLGNYGLRLMPFSHDSVGKIGVWIFFGLSAFLLTRRLETQLSRSESRGVVLAQYAIQRIFRIYPLFLPIVLAHVLLHELDPLVAWRNIVLIDGWEELWAVPVEFRWYLAMPFVALAAVLGYSRHVAIALLGGLFVVVLLGLQHPETVFANDVSLLPKAAPFVVGSWLALKHPAIGSSARSGVAAVLAILALAATAILYRLDVQGRVLVAFSPFLSAAISCVVAWLLALSLRPGWLRSALGSRPMVWLGQVSFSLYLSHMFVIKPMIGLRGVLPSPALAWLTVAAMLALAALLHRLVEQPGIKLGYRLSATVVSFRRRLRA